MVIALAIAAWWWSQPETTSAQPAAQFTWTLPDGLSLQSAPVVSPDQARLMFVGATDSGRRLFVRDLSSLAATAIPGTDDARQPFWAPDGQSVGFFAGWLRLPPDGRQLLRTIVDPLRANPDLWVEDLTRGTRLRVTTSGDSDVSPENAGQNCTG